MTNHERKIIDNKIGMLKLAQKLGNVSEACKVFGYSRDSFYRFKVAYENGGDEGLREISKKKPNPKNRIDPDIEKAILEMSFKQPAYGQVRVSNELKKEGLLISPGGVRSVWLRHELETFKKRLKALEARVAQEGGVLTEEQVVAIERSKRDDEAHGQIETEHPGYLGAQDTFYVGTIKGVGRIYQQTFIDTYTRVAKVKLYDRKNALVAADMINDMVLPFYQEHDVPLLRILTDRGTEYCGSVEHHEFELYLALEEIEHTKTKARSPQTNGICERFHKTILQEFYQVAFRKKLYESIEQLQEDVDNWLTNYNWERPHSGRFCFGKTPMETFLEGKKIVEQKMLDRVVQTSA
jgi:transposase InsO family protein